MKETQIRRIMKQNKPEQGSWVPDDCFYACDKYRADPCQHCNVPSVPAPKLLIRCPKCKRENYAIAVASGTCVWCGFSNTGTDNLETEKVK